MHLRLFAQKALDDGRVRIERGELSPVREGGRIDVYDQEVRFVGDSGQEYSRMSSVGVRRGEEPVGRDDCALVAEDLRETVSNAGEVLDECRCFWLGVFSDPGEFDEVERVVELESDD